MESDTSEIEIDDIENEIEKLQKMKMKAIERKRKAAEQAAKEALAERASIMAFKVESVPMFKTGQSWWRIGRHFYCSERRRKVKNTTVITHYLRCGDKSCPVKLKWREGTSVLMKQFRCAHNHAPQPWIVDRNKMFQALRQAVLEAGAEQPNLHDIYSTVAVRYPAGTVHLPFDNVKSSMRRWLKLAVPDIGSVENMKSLDEKLRTHPYYRARYAGSVSVDGECAVVLAMEGFGSCLAACDTMLIDVIKDLPKPISAMLTIHSLIQKNYYTPVVILMSGEGQKLYGVALSFLWSAMGILPRPQRVVAPYSAPLRRALQATGIIVPIQGCFFQYSQDILRQANDMGMDVYTRSEQWELIRLYVALALLPSQAIPQAFKGLPLVTEKNQLTFSQDFHDYFEKNWMKKNISVFKDPHRTTDVCQKYQACIRRQLAYRSSLWNFIDFRCRALNTSSDRYVQVITLDRKFHRNQARQIVAFRNLQNTNDLKSGKISVADYLVLISKKITPLLEMTNQPGVNLKEEFVDVGDEDFEFMEPDFEEHETQFDEDFEDEKEEEEEEDGDEDIKGDNNDMEPTIESEEEGAPESEVGENYARQLKEEQENFVEGKDTKERSIWNDSNDENTLANDTENNGENEVDELEETEVIGETLRENESEMEPEDDRDELESQQVEYLDDWPETVVIVAKPKAKDSASPSPPSQLSANCGLTSSRERETKHQQTTSRTGRDRGSLSEYQSRALLSESSLKKSAISDRSEKFGFVNPSVAPKQHMISRRFFSSSRRTSRDILSPEHSVISRRSVSPSHTMISTGSVATKRYVISKRPVTQSQTTSRHTVTPKRSATSRISVSPSASNSSRSFTSNSAVRPTVSAKTVISKRVVTPSQSLASRRLVTPSRSVTPVRKSPVKRGRVSVRSSEDPPTQSAAGCGLCLQSLTTEALLHCGHMLCGPCRENHAVGDPCPFCDETIAGFLRLRM